LEVRRLVSTEGSNVDGDGGNPPLFWAAYNGHAGTAKALLELGATVDGPTGTCTPLHKATHNGHPDVAALLLEAGARCVSPLCSRCIGRLPHLWSYCSVEPKHLQSTPC
jgi:hypothetical protein